MFVDYDQMLENYNKNLDENLRGFTGGPPPFEDWVPYDGDPKKSIDDLIDIARKAGNEVITVKHGEDKVEWQSPKAKELQAELDKITSLKWNCWVDIVALKRNVLTLNWTDCPKDFHENLIKLEIELSQKTGIRWNIETLNTDDINKRQIKRVGRGYENN